MTDFSRNYDDTIATIDRKLSEMIDDGAELDTERSGDVLKIIFDDGEQYIVSPNSPVEQLWLSANYAGFRFNWTGSEWANEKSGEPLLRQLADLIGGKIGEEFNF